MVELLVSCVILAVLAVAASTFFTKILDYPRRFQVRSQANSEARSCADTITRFLSNAIPATVQIQTAVNGPPMSQIVFSTPDGSNYQIGWSSSPINTAVMLSKQPGAGNAWVSTTLAHNVTGLIFTCDYRDLSVVYVTLRIDAPLNASQVETVLLPNQAIKLVGR